MQILTNNFNPNMQNKVNLDNSKIINIKIYKNKLLEKLNHLLVGNIFLKNEDIDYTYLSEKFWEEFIIYDFLEELEYMENIHISKIADDKIYFSMGYLGLHSFRFTDVDDINIITISDFLKIFINESILNINDDMDEIKCTIKEYIDAQKNESENSKNFIYYIKNKLKSIF